MVVQSRSRPRIRLSASVASAAVALVLVLSLGIASEHCSDHTAASLLHGAEVCLLVALLIPLAVPPRRSSPVARGLPLLAVRVIAAPGAGTDVDGRNSSIWLQRFLR